ncbi:MAG: alpha/beta hydrolase [Burkholderiales bacterium]|nr:MAG: alpha/beta hydrolase [Burkholderiales bacterium]
MGEGSPTVLLSAGGGGWSASWRLVQPALAATTKVCAWDRAGNGFSSGSPDPQDLMHTENDLERALAAAGLHDSLVMVAHSIGSFETLLFADRHPERVAAMVLVDPSTPDQVERLPRAAPALMAWSVRSEMLYADQILACVKAEKNVGKASPSECASLLPSYPEPLRTNLLTASNEPNYWEAYGSQMRQRAVSSKLAINVNRTYGAMPLIVLNAGIRSFPSAPTEAQKEAGALQAFIKAEQEELARLSSKGTLITIPDSSHGIPTQKPQAVIDAVGKVIAAVRSTDM